MIWLLLIFGFKLAFSAAFGGLDDDLLLIISGYFKSGDLMNLRQASKSSNQLVTKNANMILKDSIEPSLLHRLSKLPILYRIMVVHILHKYRSLGWRQKKRTGFDSLRRLTFHSDVASGDLISLLRLWRRAKLIYFDPNRSFSQYRSEDLLNALLNNFYADKSYWMLLEMMGVSDYSQLLGIYDNPETKNLYSPSTQRLVLAFKAKVSELQMESNEFRAFGRYL